MACVTGTVSSSTSSTNSSTDWAESLASISEMAAARSSSTSFSAEAWIMLATGRPATDRDSSAAGASGSTTLYEYLKISFLVSFWLFTNCWIWQQCYNCRQRHPKTLQFKAELTQIDYLVHKPDVKTKCLIFFKFLWPS